MGPQFCSRGYRVLRRYVIGYKARFIISSRLAQDNHLLDASMGEHNHFNFARVYPVPSNLNLKILAANMEKTTIICHAAKVSCEIKPLIATFRVRQELGCG